MSEGKQYKPVGGVVAAELFAVRGLASPAQMTAGTGTAVELCDAGCSYSETFTVDEGRVSVEHVLVLRADMKRAEAWFDTLKASPKRPGVDEILIPGEIENRLFEKAGDAVEIPESVIEDIQRALCEGGCSEC